MRAPAQSAWRGPAPAAELSAARGPRFGISLPTSGKFATPDHIFAAAELAESLGFDDVWVNDSYGFNNDRVHGIPVGSVEAVGQKDPNFFEGLITLAAVGGRLPRIGLGAHGLVLPVREMRLFAMQISALQELLGGRLTIAPAIGGPANFPPMGIPQSERGKRLDEALEVLTTILGSDHPVSFSGDYTAFTDATFYPRPQDIRLWIAGGSEATLRRVVEFGSGWLSTPRVLSQFPELLGRLQELAAEAGRDMDEIDRATDVFVCIADSKHEAVEMSAASLALRYGSTEAGLRHAAVGDAASVTEHLNSLVRLGFTYFEFRFVCPDRESHLEMIRRVGTEVLPAMGRLTSDPGSPLPRR